MSMVVLNNKLNNLKVIVTDEEFFCIYHGLVLSLAQAVEAVLLKVFVVVKHD